MDDDDNDDDDDYYYYYKCKKHFQFRTICNCDTAYITQLKQRKSKRCFCSTSP